MDDASFADVIRVFCHRRRFHGVFLPIMIFAPAAVPSLAAVGLPQFNIFINADALTVNTVKLLSVCGACFLSSNTVSVPITFPLS